MPNLLPNLFSIAAVAAQLVLPVVLLVVQAPSCLAAPPAKMVSSKCSGFELDQVTSLNGKYKTYVCADAVRVDHLSYGFSFVAHAPDWHVSVFRADTKQWAGLSYEQWMKANLILVSTLWTMELKKPVASRHYVQGGLSYVVYSFPSTSVTGGYFRGDHGSDYNDLVNNKSEVTCLEFPADIHAGSIAGRAVCLPPLLGTPVLATRSSATVKSWTLKTVKTRRSDALDTSLFTVPADYKKVPFNRSMFSSSSQKEDIDDFFGMGGSR